MVIWAAGTNSIRRDRPIAGPGAINAAAETSGAFLSSEVFDVANGDIVGWVGVQAQVAVVGVSEAPLEFGAVVPGGFREPVPEGVAQVVRPERAELAFAVGDLGVVEAAEPSSPGAARRGYQGLAGLGRGR